MAFVHESFWVATSAVAPVIALAAVVALPDVALIGRATVLRDKIQRRQPSDDEEDRALQASLVDEAQSTRRWAWTAWLITIANLIIQAGLLAVSLCALALRQDIMSFWAAICLATIGILLLALSAFCSIVARWDLEGGTFSEGGRADSYLAPTTPPIATPEEGCPSQGSEI